MDYLSKNFHKHTPIKHFPINFNYQQNAAELRKLSGNNGNSNRILSNYRVQPVKSHSDGIMLHCKSHCFRASWCRCSLIRCSVLRSEWHLISETNLGRILPVLCILNTTVKLYHAWSGSVIINMHNRYLVVPFPGVLVFHITFLCLCLKPRPFLTVVRFGQLHLHFFCIPFSHRNNIQHFFKTRSFYKN